MIYKGGLDFSCGQTDGGPNEGVPRGPRGPKKWNLAMSNPSGRKSSTSMGSSVLWQLGELLNKATVVVPVKHKNIWQTLYNRVNLSDLF